MCLTIAYSKIKKRNFVLINNATQQRETLSERPIRQPLNVERDVRRSRVINIAKSFEMIVALSGPSK